MRGQRGGAAHAALFEQRWQMLSCFGVGGIGREEADVNRVVANSDGMLIVQPGSILR